MKKLILVLILFFAVNGQAETKVYFSPNGGCQQAIINKINEAEQIVQIAIFDWNLLDILKAVERANERGAIVQIIMDRRMTGGKYSLYPEINKDRNKWIVKTKRGNGGGLAHNKILIIDDKYLCTGSYNWSNGAEKRNDENLLITDDAGIIKEYREYFETLWEIK